jgi:predicted GNAT family N-acyltransferase
MSTADAEVAVRWVRGRVELAGALALREEVFYGEQGVPRQEDLDGRDAGALHVVALDPGTGEVIGTLRLLLEERPAKIGRVVVDRRWRRRGIASRMLELALERARREGCAQVRLAAQVRATAVYEQAGFRIESEPFEEAGIPHVWMGCSLAASESAAAP